MPVWVGNGTTNNWSEGANWDTGSAPTSTTTAIFNGVGANGNKNCTITAGALCTDFILTGYSGQITFANSLTVTMTSTAGNIAFSASLGFSMIGPNGISYNVPSVQTRTITTNGYVFNLPFTFSGLGGATLNLVGDFQVSNYTGGNINFTGNELRVSGNWSGGAGGPALKVLNGTGTVANGSSIVNLVINAPSFTRTFSGTINIGSSLRWIAGTLITTGTTFSCGSMTSIDFSGQSLNNVTFSNTITTAVFPSDLNILGNLTLGNGPTFNGPGKIFLNGNLTGNGTVGNLVIEMNGTGTVLSTVNLSTIINTSGVITIGSTAVFSSVLTLTSGTLNLLNPLVKQGSNLIITSGITLSGSGLLRLINYANLNTTINLTSNGIIWPNDVEISPSGGGGNLAVTLNLVDNFTVSGNFSIVTGGFSNAQQVINTSNLIARSNFSCTPTGGVGGTSTIIFDGANNMNWSMLGPMQNNININKSGGAIVSILNSFAWGAAGRTLQRTTGNINPTTSTITIPNNVSVTIDNMTFWNLTVNGTGTINQNVLNTIQNNLTLAANGNVTFSGTSGWNCANLLCSTANRTITLQEGLTYNTSNNANMLGTDAQRITMSSSSVTNRAIWTLAPAATQSIVYVNGTRINSSLGQTIWSFGGTLNDTLNWGLGTQPQTIAFTFIG